MAQHLYSRAIASPSCEQLCAARFALNLCRWPLLLLWLNLSGRRLRQKREIDWAEVCQEAADNGEPNI